MAASPRALHGVPGQILDGLTRIKGKSRFAADLLERYEKYGSLSDREIDVANNLLASDEFAVGSNFHGMTSLVDFIQNSCVCPRVVFEFDDMAVIFVRNLLEFAAELHFIDVLYISGDKEEELDFGELNARGSFCITGECARPGSIIDMLYAMNADPLAFACKYIRVEGKCPSCGRYCRLPPNDRSANCFCLLLVPSS